MRDGDDPRNFRVPQDLVVEPSEIRRVLVIGSCLAGAWMTVLAQEGHTCEVSVYFTGHPLPDTPEHPIETYDFQLLQLALRFVLPDGAYSRLGQADVAGHDRLLADCIARIRTYVDYAMRWNRESGLLTFFMPFIVPQQNLVGRLLPRYDLRNPVYFVEKLNEAVAAECANYRNAYFFEFNEVLATFGRRHILEDQVMMFNHGSFLFDFDFLHDQNRIEPVRPATEIFDGKVGPILSAAWRELSAMVRTIRQKDQVKLIIFDLDDTLWRGVAAEYVDRDYPTSDGWPKALWEACHFLKRRGVMLAIVSKNDEANIRAIWRDIFRGVLDFDDFVATRINWMPKPNNIADILSVVNLMPGSVLFIDDNPAERAAVKAAFPEMRVIGGNPVTWRRILLASAEMQVAQITKESSERTAMMQAQARREADRLGVDHRSFVAAAKVTVRPIVVETIDHSRFPRVLELVNKTNQFNTTGQRWSREECQRAFADGVRIIAFEVEDCYTDYGLVAAGIVANDLIHQFVMSCRVMGLGVETTAIAYVVESIGRSGWTDARANQIDTPRNLPCRDLYARCGFKREDAEWRCAMVHAPVAEEYVTLLC